MKKLLILALLIAMIIVAIVSVKIEERTVKPVITPETSESSSIKSLDIVLNEPPTEIETVKVEQHSNPGQIIATKERSSCDYTNSEGASFKRGEDENGNPICGFSYYNACPYSEAVSADDPMCYKTNPQ